MDDRNERPLPVGANRQCAGLTDHCVALSATIELRSLDRVALQRSDPCKNIFAVIVKVFPTKSQLGAAAAAHAASTIRDSIRERGVARIIAATGASQFEFFEALTQAPEIDWQRVELFHLDEYLGLPITHPASFRKYLLDRLINKVGIIRHHLLNGEQDPAQTIAQVTRELRKAP